MAGQDGTKRLRRGPRHGRLRAVSFCEARSAATCTPLDPRQALQVLCLHERLLANLPDPVESPEACRQQVFLAGYILLAAAGSDGSAWCQPEARAARRGAAAIALGQEETDVALGFVRLLGARSWGRFRLQSMLEWTAAVRLAFLTAQVATPPQSRTHLPRRGIRLQTW